MWTSLVEVDYYSQVVVGHDPNNKNIWKHPVWLRHHPYHGPIRIERPINDESLTRVVELWKTDSPMSFREFWKRYTDVACFNWTESDEDTKDKETAAGITYRINAITLASLPYPPETILFAVNYVSALGYFTTQMISEWLHWIRMDRGESGLWLPLHFPAIRMRFSDPVPPRVSDVSWARWARWGREGWNGFCWRDPENTVELPVVNLPVVHSGHKLLVFLTKNGILQSST